MLSEEQAARELACVLCALIAQQRDDAGHTGHNPLLARARNAFASLVFDSPEGDFILYRLLVAQPWSERLSDPGMRAARLFGRVLDLPGMFHRFERPIADAWCKWSLHWLRSLSRAWREASAPVNIVA